MEVLAPGEKIFSGTLDYGILEIDCRDCPDNYYSNPHPRRLPMDAILLTSYCGGLTATSGLCRTAAIVM